MPKVYVINEQQPSQRPQVLCQALSERELRGVMAHELAHVKHRDMLIPTIPVTGAIASFA
ncbi:MAG: heat shock protein HtpX [Methylophilaceae bacterium]|jgi:heat shock protein HtpX